METYPLDLNWLPLSENDLANVMRIAQIIHPQLFEQISVFAEKINYCPEACLKWTANQQLYGYGLAHPWQLYSIPKLNHLLSPSFSEMNCIYIHDVAILPSARGFNATEKYINYLKGLAISLQINYLALVSVYATEAFWKRLGFDRQSKQNCAASLTDYGNQACYMINQINL
jgi:hypothetical protein